MFYFDCRLALVSSPARRSSCIRSSGSASASAARRAASQEELEHLSHVTDRSVHRPPHRQGVRRRGAREPRFRRASERLYRTNLKVTSTVAILPPLMEFLGGVADRRPDLVRQPARSTAAAMTQGDFLAFVVAAFMMYAPIKKLSRVNANLQQAMAASERIFEMLDTHSEVEERAGASRCRRSGSAIEFRERQLRVRRRGREDTSCATCRSRSPPGRWSRSWA